MRVLFTPYCGGSIAHVVRSLALADELKARGHTILFTTSRSRRAFIEAAGYAVHGQGHPDVNLNDESDQGISYFRRNREDFLAWFRDEIEAAESFRPDVIVNSPSFFGAIASKKLGIPHVSIINGNWHPDYLGVLGLSLCTDRLAHRIARTVLRPVLAHGFDRIYMEEIRGWYKELRIQPLPECRRALHTGLRALIPGIPSLEPIRKGVPNVHYIGPLQWQGFEAMPFDLPPAWQGDRRPLVYATLGGSVFSGEVYARLLDAFAARDNWRTVVSLGPNFSRNCFAPDLPHLIIRQFVPGLQLCKRADIVVNTASHGTIMQALSHGKPIIALPRNIDQATFAQRLVELGAGKNLSPVPVHRFTDRSAYASVANARQLTALLAAVDHELHARILTAGATALSIELARHSGDGEASLMVDQVAAAK